MERLPFREIWCVDFEFRAPDGERPAVRCMVAKEALSGRLLRVWANDLATMKAPPFPIDEGTLFVAYFASAEMGCFLALGWDMPARILDLYVERRRITNGRGLPAKGRSLVVTMEAYGLASIGSGDKEKMRNLAMRAGDHYAEAERAALLDYCQSDVDALVELLPAMLPDILDGPTRPTRVIGQALLRGRYMAAVARMEYAGVPIDVGVLEKLRAQWDAIRGQLVGHVDRDYGVYDGLAFRSKRFEDYLCAKKIPWPRLNSGPLDLSGDTFRQMAKAHPAIAPLHELRHTMAQLKLHNLAVGADGRNRTLLSPFASKTGRNQPSNSKFIFGPSRWLRSLIAPEPGTGFVYCDFGNQEIGIAAALSGDPGLIAGYEAGDPYIDFGYRSGFIPETATKETHPGERQLLKGTVLGIGYGMREHTLAGRLGITSLEAKQLIQRHQEAYPVFWEWSVEICDRAMLTGQLSTELGWTITLDSQSIINPRSLMNFPMQANGAEMLRLACCLATEDGLEIVAPVHDALAMVAPIADLHDHTGRLLAHMRLASEIVLSGFTIRAEVEARIIYPDRYGSCSDGGMWATITGMLN